MMVLAQLSDIHLDGGSRADERAARVMAYLEALPTPVDVVLATGDLADHGELDEYRRAAELLKSSSFPVFTCPGNHDRRSAYREALLGVPPSEEPVNEAHHVDGVLFALCDSSVPGKPEGFLSDETLEWLDRELTESEGPAFVCFHHPPVELGIPAVDAMRQFGEERLAAVIERHPRVSALLCGHAHTPAATTFAGRPLLVAPGVTSTTRLFFEPGGARGWADGGPIDHDLPPMLSLHLLHDDGRLTTHHRVVTA
ncbi:phosphodiesterase [Amycolatopsis sp. H20-H5]|uniref:phosphodiesterase n=1 Tax=Amycolatopsis sp. H20-H5 TaxID=3046309 RepID=UPI002DB56443|nr:phosphodiesterase [Amycolatopsis sp. H20-H5]MEC3979417.1 phosphodiesterase [Amycolatopsis sp. H20-H5]